MNWQFWKNKEKAEQKPVYQEDVGKVRNLHEKLAQIPVGYGFLLPCREGMKEFKCVGIRDYPEKGKI